MLKIITEKKLLPVTCSNESQKNVATCHMLKIITEDVATCHMLKIITENVATCHMIKRITENVAHCHMIKRKDKL